MNKYTIINFTCFGLILFANLGTSINFLLLGIQFGAIALQFKEARHG